MPLPILSEEESVQTPEAFRQSPMTLEQFQRRNWELGDGLKYEWHDGFVEAGEERMKVTEIGIVTALTDAFVKSRHFQGGSRLLSEIEIHFSASKSYRRPDLSGFTLGEIKRAKEGDELVIPTFVIEVISTHDNANHLEKKLREYFISGVQVVWQVFPDYKLVRVFRSLTDSTGFVEDQVCSAAPAFPDFAMKVSEIFA